MSIDLRVACWLTLSLFIQTAGAESELDLGPHDFAFGRVIEIERAGPLQTVPLDRAVYRGSVESRLADLRVFNGAGEPVPHAIRPLMPSKAAAGALVAAPLFRLPEAAAAATSRTQTLTTDDERTYSINAEVSANGAILNVTSQPSNDPNAVALPTAYLLDTSQIEHTVVGLELDLGAETAEFIAPLDVEASDDLVRFRSVESNAVLARLSQSGHRIERSDVGIAAGRYRYLRLSWPDGKPPVEIRSVQARLAPHDDVLDRQRVLIPGAPVGGEPDAFVFDLGGTIPIDHIQIDLPAANTVIEARLSSAATPEGPWADSFSGLLFELDGDTPLQNPAIRWPANRHRYVKLIASGKGGGIGGGVPTLQAAWYPEQLLFIAHGAPPYRLGYGRGGAAASRFDATELITTANIKLKDVPLATARLGDEYATASPDVLVATAPPIATRTIALWAVLLLSVLVALVLSIRLARQIRAAP